MEKRLKKGDKVRMRRTVCFDYITFETGCVGEVSSDEDNKGFCRIRMKNAENEEMTEHFICANNLELIDSKTAFLSDLADVLRKHNAEIIGGSFDGYGDYLQVRLGNESPFDVGEDNQYDGVVLTADNIMDFNKE